jgi:hypothetical protein
MKASELVLSKVIPFLRQDYDIDESLEAVIRALAVSLRFSIHMAPVYKVRSPLRGFVDLKLWDADGRYAQPYIIHTLRELSTFHSVYFYYKSEKNTIQYRVICRIENSDALVHIFHYWIETIQKKSKPRLIHHHGMKLIPMIELKALMMRPMAEKFLKEEYKDIGEWMRNEGYLFDAALKQLRSKL